MPSDGPPVLPPRLPVRPPRCQAGPTEPTHPPSRKLPAIGSRLGVVNKSGPEAKLLVVDDEPNIRELLSTSLRFAGFEVVAAANGREALAAAERTTLTSRSLT